MPKNALITGVTGQDGAYLAALLLEKGYRVIGTTRDPQGWPWRLKTLGIMKSVELVRHPGNALDAFRALLDSHAPDEIYNLAAQSSLVDALKDPYGTALANAMEPVTLLEAVRLNLADARIFQATSVQIFGASPDRSMPENFYGATKMFAHLTCKTYREQGLFVATGALGAHESPLRGEQFLSRKVISTLAAIRLGLSEPLAIGNLDAERDWGWAPDFVEAMHMMLQLDTPGDFILATGRVRKVRDLIESACAFLGFDIGWKGAGVAEVGLDRENGRIIVRVDPSFFRPFDDTPPLLDISGTRQTLGWAPRTDFETMVRQMCEAELARLAQLAPGEIISNRGL